jgi:hypothetical protein
MKFALRNLEFRGKPQEPGTGRGKDKYPIPLPVPKRKVQAAARVSAG